MYQNYDGLNMLPKHVGQTLGWMFWAGAAPDVGPHIGRWVAAVDRKGSKLSGLSRSSLLKTSARASLRKQLFFKGKKEKGSSFLGSVASKHPARHMLDKSVKHRFRFPSFREIHFIPILIIYDSVADVPES